MKSNRTFYAILFVILFAGHTFAQENQHKAPLWNVTQDGDTLRYISSVQEQPKLQDMGLPGYVSELKYRELISDSLQYKLEAVRFPDTPDLSKVLSIRKEDIEQIQPATKNIWLPLTAMVISGGVSAYFKLEANTIYKKYQKAVDEDNINKYYNLTRKYDTYSAISFVILEGSFGWMIYKLLR
jgi:hypothetical protein